MSSFAKTVRFYDTNRDRVAMEALNNYADYGFASANDMIVTLLYELANGHNTITTTLPIDELANMISERLKGDLHVVADTSDAPNSSSSCSSGPAILNAPDSVSDSDIQDIMADILSF